MQITRSAGIASAKVEEMTVRWVREVKIHGIELSGPKKYSDKMGAPSISTTSTSSTASSLNFYVCEIKTGGKLCIDSNFIVTVYKMSKLIY